MLHRLQRANSLTPHPTQYRSFRRRRRRLHRKISAKFSMRFHRVSRKYLHPQPFSVPPKLELRWHDDSEKRPPSVRRRRSTIDRNKTSNSDDNKNIQITESLDIDGRKLQQLKTNSKIQQRTNNALLEQLRANLTIEKRNRHLQTSTRARIISSLNCANYHCFPVPTS